MIKKSIQFSGRHYETGSVQNALMLQNVKAPHTNKPYSEALLLGVSGGITFGYFTFEYKGLLPHIALLARNTFDPFQTMLERLGVEQQVYQTTKSEIAEKNLIQTLSTGTPAILWADENSLPYLHKNPAAYWNMIPIVAYGIEDDEVLIADRSMKPLRVKMEALTKARARVKDDKFRLITIASPLTSKLVPALQKGIWQCVSLFTDKPPKGARHNFGFAAYEHFADLLTNKRNKQSWSRLFPAGPKLFNALAGFSEGKFTPPGMFVWINNFWASDGMERDLYADFLDEASILLEEKSLKEVAKQFRLSHKKWLAFADAILPSSIAPFGEVKKLLLRKQELFVNEGENGFDELEKINTRLKKLETEITKKFPMNQTQATELYAELREHVLAIAQTEKQGIEMLQSAMA